MWLWVMGPPCPLVPPQAVGLVQLAGLCIRERSTVHGAEEGGEDEQLTSLYTLQWRELSHTALWTLRGPQRPDHPGRRHVVSVASQAAPAQACLRRAGPQCTQPQE